MKTKLIALIAGILTVVVAAIVIAAVIYNAEVQNLIDEMDYSTIQTPSDIVQNFYDSDFDGLGELLESLQNRTIEHQASPITSDWYNSALGNLLRQPITEQLERPDMSNMGLFYPLPPIIDDDIPPEDIPPYPDMLFVPLKDVDIFATLEGSLATVDFTMTYINPGENPIECTYEFPLEAHTVLSRLFVVIGDTVIEARVFEREEAEVLYQDIISEGNLGVYVER